MRKEKGDHRGKEHKQARRKPCQITPHSGAQSEHIWCLVRTSKEKQGADGRQTAIGKPVLHRGSTNRKGWEKIGAATSGQDEGRRVDDREYHPFFCPCMCASRIYDDGLKWWNLVWRCWWWQTWSCQWELYVNDSTSCPLFNFDHRRAVSVSSFRRSSALVIYLGTLVIYLRIISAPALEDWRLNHSSCLQHCLGPKLSRESHACNPAPLLPLTTTRCFPPVHGKTRSIRSEKLKQGAVKNRERGHKELKRWNFHRPGGFFFLFASTHSSHCDKTEHIFISWLHIEEWREDKSTMWMEGRTKKHHVACLHHTIDGFEQQRQKASQGKIRVPTNREQQKKGMTFEWGDKGQCWPSPPSACQMLIYAIQIEPR